MAEPNMELGHASDPPDKNSESHSDAASLDPGSSEGSVPIDPKRNAADGDLEAQDRDVAPDNARDADSQSEVTESSSWWKPFLIVLSISLAICFCYLVWARKHTLSIRMKIREIVEKAVEDRIDIEKYPELFSKKGISSTKHARLIKEHFFHNNIILLTDGGAEVVNLYKQLMDRFISEYEEWAKKNVATKDENINNDENIWMRMIDYVKCSNKEDNAVLESIIVEEFIKAINKSSQKDKYAALCYSITLSHEQTKETLTEKLREMKLYSDRLVKDAAEIHEKRVMTYLTPKVKEHIAQVTNSFTYNSRKNIPNESSLVKSVIAELFADKPMCSNEPSWIWNEERATSRILIECVCDRIGLERYLEYVSEVGWNMHMGSIPDHKRGEVVTQLVRKVLQDDDTANTVIGKDIQHIETFGSDVTQRFGYELCAVLAEQTSTPNLGDEELEYRVNEYINLEWFRYKTSHNIEFNYDEGTSLESFVQEAIDANVKGQNLIQWTKAAFPRTFDASNIPENDEGEPLWCVCVMEDEDVY